jgi:hypothetical protein
MVEHGGTHSFTAVRRRADSLPSPQFALTRATLSIRQLDTDDRCRRPFISPALPKPTDSWAPLFSTLSRVPPNQRKHTFVTRRIPMRINITSQPAMFCWSAAPGYAYSTRLRLRKH